MFYVYILQSQSFPEHSYVGFTTDIFSRLAKHNEGGNVSTASWRPWSMIFYCAFSDKARALRFESYLKSHSGKAFASKRLI
jgi:predicted GIY-YIG superfamily endonuclease